MNPSSWLFIALSGYFLGALSAVVDKFLLVRPISSPLVYTFFIGLLSVTTLILTPFGFGWPGWPQLLIDFAVGVIYILFAFSYYTAIKKDEVSRVVPLIGSITPFFVFVLSFLFLGERLSANQIIAFLFLVVGGIAISYKKSEDGYSGINKYFIKGLAICFWAALTGALYYVAAKFAFTNQPFLSNFIWTRLGTFLAIFALLIPRKNRELIFGASRTMKIKTGGTFVFNKAVAGLSFLLINYSVSLASVSLVNAIQGIQYLFILILTVILTKKHLEDLEEKFSWPAVVQKIIAVILIGIGLIFLAY